MSDAGGWFAPVVSLTLALVLAVLPLPQIADSFRPDWVAMVMLYWSLVAPQRVGLLTALVVGLILDTLTGARLGQHPLALLTIVYLLQRFHFQIRAFPASQVMLIVVVLLGLYEFILFWIDGVAGRTVPMIDRWLPVLTGAVLWFAMLFGVERSRVDTGARM